MEWTILYCQGQLWIGVWPQHRQGMNAKWFWVRLLTDRRRKTWISVLRFRQIDSVYSDLPQLRNFTVRKWHVDREYNSQQESHFANKVFGFGLWVPVDSRFEPNLFSHLNLREAVEWNFGFTKSWMISETCELKSIWSFTSLCCTQTFRTR